MSRKITVKLRSKPVSISPEYRIEYKICMLVLVLKLCCIKEKGSINKVNYIMNALSTYKGITKFKTLKKASAISADLDKTLLKTINVAIFNKLIKLENGQLVLQPNGSELVDFIHENDIFKDEFNILFEKSKNFITEGQLKKGEQDAKN